MSLATAVSQVLADKAGVFGVYARILTTGETIEIAADRVLPARPRCSCIRSEHPNRSMCRCVSSVIRRLDSMRSPSSKRWRVRRSRCPLRETSQRSTRGSTSGRVRCSSANSTSSVFQVACTFIDSGLFETDASSWVVAAMAAEQTDFASRPDDTAPAAFREIGELLYDAWSSP